MNKTLMTVVGALVVIIAVGFFAYNYGRGSSLQAVEKNNSAAQSPSGKLEWHFAEAGTDETNSAPLTKVTLMAGDKTHDLGAYTGSCSVIESSAWELLQNEKTGAICWFAGGGTELGVFEESGKLTVKKGELSEGEEGGAGFRGNFETLVVL